MAKSDNTLKEVYNQYGISSNQYFVALQKAYNMVCRAYWGDSIHDFDDQNGNTKEYAALNTAFEKVDLSNMDWRSFRGMWKRANQIKHSNETFEFSTDYARLCAETYNNVVYELVGAEGASGYELDVAKFVSKDESDKKEGALAIAFKNAIKEAEKRELKAVAEKREEDKQKIEMNICPKCGGKLVLRTNRKTQEQFWGCSSWRPDKTGCFFTKEYIEPQTKSKALKRPYKYGQGTQWFESREREKGGKVRYVQSLGLSFSLLKELSEDEERYDNFRCFSHWRFDYKDFSAAEVNTNLRSVAALAYKLLTRGKLTIISPKVEKLIGEAFGNMEARPECLVGYQRKHSKPYFWLDGQGTESHFYKEILPKIFGHGYERYIIPQVDLATLISTKEDIGRQRVDFAINDGKHKIAIELDDSSHSNHAEYDDIRDTLLEDAGFRVARIPNSEVKLGSAYISSLEKLIAEPKLDTDELLSAKGMIAGKIIHQIEIIVVYGLMHGFFNSDEHISVDLDTELFSSKEIDDIKAIVTADINEFLSRISDLYSLSCSFHIDLTWENQSGHISESYKEISYNTEKRATADRIIVSDFAYAHDFMNNLPQYDSVNGFSGNGETLSYFMQYFFRKPEFREGQFETISNTLNKKDLVILLPTGAGKSIAFQLAALLTPGIAFVVSPLVSLMMDQVDNLKQYGIDRAKALTGALSNEAKEEMSDLIVSGDSIITYISPERLQIQSFRRTIEDTLREVPIPLFVIDEAHCLSEWGHDFRTSYLNLGRIIRDYCQYDGKAPTIIALTGTASDNVLTDIRNQLDIWKEGSLITPNKFDRKELHYQVVSCKSGEKQHKLMEVLKNMPAIFGMEDSEFYALNGDETYSGLIFCPWVNGDYGINEIGRLVSTHYSCELYSGKKPKRWRGHLTWDEQKRKSAADFKYNKCNILVATKAYGMGIDKPNIRFIIHYNIAQSIEAYYQETGRAGRDRQDSKCILLSSLEGGDDDYSRIEFFHNNAYKGQEEELSCISGVLDKLDITTPKEQKITFVSDNENNRISTEKAIYRLLLIGLIDDYKKIREDEYSITISDVNPEKIKNAFIECIGKYHEGRVDSESKKVEKIHTTDLREYIMAVEAVLIDFLYDNIVSSRKEAMVSMRELAKKASSASNQDKFIHQEIENYLMTNDQEAIGIIVNGVRAGLKESADFYINGDYKSLNTLRGQLTRQIESHPDHPGLILARAFLDSTDNKSSEDDVLTEISKALSFAKERYSATPEDIKGYFSWMLKEIATKNQTFALEVSEQIKDVYSSSEMLDVITGITDDDEKIAPFAYRYMADYSDDVVKIIGGYNE